MEIDVAAVSLKTITIEAVVIGSGKLRPRRVHKGVGGTSLPRTVEVTVKPFGVVIVPNSFSLPSVKRRVWGSTVVTLARVVIAGWNEDAVLNLTSS